MKNMNSTHENITMMNLKSTTDDKTTLTEKSKSQQSNQKIIDEYDYLSNAASMQDCTGLIPSEPVSVEEIESYEELYHFLPPNGRAANIKPDEHPR
ncbi:hypothetical protein ACQRBN_02525 [Bariatricus sp. SGI.154]|uniref:hypothetical protein n=1 Tax=Bariatricus sp. SGI.154 TaxID=3420549 RepID=UPI003D05DF32